MPMTEAVYIRVKLVSGRRSQLATAGPEVSGVGRLSIASIGQNLKNGQLWPYLLCFHQYRVSGSISL